MERKKAIAHEPPFTHSYSRELLIFDRGEGIYLYDVEGKRYLDFGAGIAVNALGYGREDLAEIAAAQMRKLVHTSNLFTTEPPLRLGERLLELGDFSAVHFGNSGTEANEAALKFARLYSFRTKGAGHEKLLCFESAFHGRTMGALSVTPNPAYKEAFEPLIPGVEVLPYNDVARLRATLDDSFAGVIVEVVQGEGGLRCMTGEFAAALNEACRQNDAILIADEVQTGLGRTGLPLASEVVGLQPDIVTLAKPLGGGLPLSATLIPSKIDRLVKVGDHGSTFGGGPVTAAISNAIIETLLDPDFLEEVRSKSTVLREGLERIRAGYAAVRELRGMGMLQGLALDPEKPSLIPEVLIAAREKGLVVLRSGKNVVRIAPPLVITREQIGEGLSLLESALGEVRG